MMLAAMLAGMKEDTRVIQATRTRQVNWWGSSFKIIIQSRQRDLQEMAETIKLPKEVKTKWLWKEGLPRSMHAEERAKLHSKTHNIAKQH